MVSRTPVLEHFMQQVPPLLWCLVCLLFSWKQSKPSRLWRPKRSILSSVFFSPALTWRDVQYLITYTANRDRLVGGKWVTNGGGLRVSHKFGFGAIDAEAIVSRGRNWINVPAQMSQDVVPLVSGACTTRIYTMFGRYESSCYNITL